MLEFIQKKFQERGWNLYSIQADLDTFSEIIGRGPSKTLAQGKYVVFPKSSNSSDFTSVRNTMNYTCKMNIYPIISYKNVDIPLSLLEFQELSVLVNWVRVDNIDYAEFLKALDTLTPIADFN